MSEEVEGLLARASQPGEGRFTLDLWRAQGKLARYQLADPNTYVLKLVQWAVASEASEVRVEIEKDGVSVAHDGRPTEVADLGALMESADPGLQHLAAGLVGAYGLGARSIVLDSGGVSRALLGEAERVPTGEGTRVRVKVKPNALQWANRGAEAGVGVALVAGGCYLGYTPVVMFLLFALGLQAVLKGGLNSDWDFLGDARWMFRADFALVRFRCVYAPVPVYLNGRPLNRPWFGYGGRTTITSRGLEIWPSRPYSGPTCCYLVGSQTNLPGPVVGPAFWASPRATLQRVGDLTDWELSELVPEGAQRMPGLRIWGQPALGCRALLCRCAPGKGGYPHSELSWVKDGVVIETERGAPGLPEGMRAVVSAQDLDTDLSHFKLIRDEGYRAVYAEVLRAAQLLPSRARSGWEWSVEIGI